MQKIRTVSYCTTRGLWLSFACLAIGLLLFMPATAEEKPTVWAYALPNGKWSYPFGPGTTELPDHFDLVTPPALTRALLEQRAGEWLARSRREGSPILARLAADDHWELLEFRSVRSHFDLDSGYRWEWHGDKRIGILHIHGRRWRYNEESYEPDF